MVIDFKTLVQTLQKQASASTTKAAAGDTPSVTDPADKGTVAVPKDPNAAPALTHIPESATNADITPVTTVSVARTVGDKSASTDLVAKAAKVASGIRALMNKSATAAEITPTLPSDKANDNKNSTPTAAATAGPAKKQNPDPEAKIATEQQPGAKAAAEGDVAAKTPGGTPADPEAKKVEAPKADTKGELPKDKDNTDDTKKASDTDLSFDPAFHFKLASSLLATEEGRAYAQHLIEAEHGAAEADSIIKAAAFMEQQFNELQAAEVEGASAADALWAQATPEEQAAAIKMAHAHYIARETLATDMEKQAYDDGAATAAQMQDQGALGGAPGADAGAGAPPAGADAGAEGAPADGGGEVSDDDIVQVLQQLVQSGEVKPEEAEAIMQALLGGQGGEGAAPGGAAPGGAPMPGEQAGMPGGAPGGDMPPEAKAASELVKSASAITDSLLAAVAAPVK